MGAYGVIQTAANAGNSILGNQLARQNEDWARGKNYIYGEMTAEKADQRTRKLYADLQSPKALLEQYKEAGISPSLMFGNGANGAAPTSGAQGSGAAGIAPTTFGVEAFNIAQTDLMAAEARKANAEADTEMGLNEKGEALISKYLNEAASEAAKKGNLEAHTALIQMQTSIAELERDIKSETFWDDVTRIKETTRKIVADANAAEAEASIKQRENKFDDETYETKVRMFRNEARKIASEIINIRTDTEVKKKQAKWFEKQCAKMQYDMQVDYYYAQLEGKKFDFEKAMEINKRKFEIACKEVETDLELRDQEIEMWKQKWDVITSIATSAISAAGQFAKGNSPTTTTETKGVYDNKGNLRGYTKKKKEKR